jgi:hypothetical protein
MSSTVCRGEHSAQSGYRFPTGEIRPASDGGDDRLERSLGNVRRREGEPGIKNTKPGGMQNRGLSE